jgi:catechol 2,3-dioxygenase-like lactoylglutathione lyase family enzyme
VAAIDHLDLVVTDLERSLDFYARVDGVAGWVRGRGGGEIESEPAAQVAELERRRAESG